MTIATFSVSKNWVFQKQNFLWRVLQAKAVFQLQLGHQPGGGCRTDQVCDPGLFASPQFPYVCLSMSVRALRWQSKDSSGLDTFQSLH